MSKWAGFIKDVRGFDAKFFGISPREAAGMLLPVLLIMDVLAIWNYRHDYDLGNIKVMAPGIVLGVGYNGTVAGIDIDWNDRDARRPFVIHAEANALRYVTPEMAAGGLLATTHFPCSSCVLLAASYGVREIVWLYPPDWERYPADLTQSIARRLGVVLRRIDGDA